MAVLDLDYTSVPGRALETVREEAAKDREVDHVLERFWHVGVPVANEDGDTEDLDGVDVTHRFVEAPGDSEMLTWHYVEAGDGEPIVLLHGMPDSWYLWQMQIPELAHTHRVLAFDLKGFGQSDKRTGDYRHEGVAEQLLAALDVLGLERFNLVSHDRGTVQGDYLAGNHPDRVLRYGRGEQHLYHYHPTLSPQEAFYANAETNILLKDPHRYVVRTYTKAAVRPVPDSHIERTIREWSHPDIWRAVPRYFNSSSFRKEWIDRRTRLLDAWSCTITIMQGADDRKQPREFYEGVEELIPHADVAVRFLDAGHFYPVEAPEETTATILELLDRPAQAAPA